MLKGSCSRKDSLQKYHVLSDLGIRRGSKTPANTSKKANEESEGDTVEEKPT